MNRKLLPFLGFFWQITLLFAQSNTQMKLIPLDKPWFFRQAGTSVWLNATVPGTVHTDLMANNMLEDPYFRTNEKKSQWVDKVDWEYKVSFWMEESDRNSDKISLVFDGLDTYAEIYLNGHFLFSADNFFTGWETDIKDFLREGENNLRLYFHAPTRKGMEMLEKQGFGLPASNDQSENGEMGDHKVSVFLRKPGYHFGWDWGPRLVSSGIFRPVKIYVWNHARQKDLYIKQLQLNDTLAELESISEVEVIKAGNYTLELWCQDKKLTNTNQYLEIGRHTLSRTFTIENPQRWWTHDLGTPHLYEIEVKLIYQDQLLDVRKRNIGLRTIKVIQEADQEGASFYFELNGRPIFAKGANYIPSDVFIPRVTDQQYQWLLHSVVDANMNMLRVWGGGFYEHDLFYDLCDAKGILVWQDFMFACSMYPGDADFLRRVKHEAIYNIKRLRNHPSIALWCGNNEIDVAWAQFKEFKGWGWKQKYGAEKRKYIWKAYEDIFHQLLPEMVQTYHEDSFYWPSSPYYKKGDHASKNTPAGDIHYWGVWHEQHPFDDFYRYIGRFMSEYGFQSFPEMRTVSSYTLPEDWDITSEVMAAHQRSGIGNMRIKKYMEDHYEIPEKFEHFLYIGQLLQAEGIRIAIEAHRQAMPYNMGSLYWQLNDCWPVASWSGMDYYQRWKALHYFVKDAFSPLLVSVRQHQKHLEIRAVSDRISTDSLSLNIRLIDFGGKLLYTDSLPFVTPSNTSRELLSLPLNELIPKGVKPNKVCLELLARDEAGKIHARDLHYFVPIKELDLPKNHGVNIQMEQQGLVYVIKLNASGLAKNAYLDFPEIEGYFSKNFVDILPGSELTLYFSPKSTDHKILTAQDLSLLTIQDTLKRNQ
jgi:beta-mannosidase